MYLRQSKIGLIAICISGGMVVSVDAVMVIEGFNAARHDRFANVPASFVGGSLDYSGVSRASNGGWVTMLNDPGGGDPKFFVSSRHKQPSGTVTFHVNNDPSGLTTTGCSIGAGTGMAVGTTDIWIGTVSGCDTSIITGYDIASSLSVGSTVLQIGDTDANYGSIANDMRVGRNVLDFTLAATLIGRTGEWAFYADDSGSGDLTTNSNQGPNYSVGTDETYFQGGDSGGPTFVDNGGTLELIGTHAFIADLETPQDNDNDGEVDVDANGDPIYVLDRRASGDAYLPNSSAAINAKISAVPEPSSLLCVAFVACGFWIGKLFGFGRSI